jgi:hypothetical protein
MTRLVIAAQDPSLQARVVGQVPLLYGEGPDAALDRPGHVRAGSGLVRLGSRLAVLQDDAHFVALVDPASGCVRSVALPPGPGGARQFDDQRGTKHWKLDLEACVAMPMEDGQLMVAFGSGSGPARERILTLLWQPETPIRVQLHDARRLYGLLRATTDFAGSELNLEGAVLLDGGRLRLFQRGNGARRDGLEPVDATVELAWDELRAYLAEPQRAPVPALHEIVRYRLGELDGVRLSFTDAAVLGGAVAFTAVAEASPDAVRDGPVSGVALGLLELPNAARWTQLQGLDGRAFTGKAEGLCFDPDRPGRAWVVLDRDDPAAPSELCELELSGPWPAPARRGQV